MDAQLLLVRDAQPDALAVSLWRMLGLPDMLGLEELLGEAVVQTVILADVVVLPLRDGEAVLLAQRVGEEVVVSVGDAEEERVGVRVPDVLPVPLPAVLAVGEAEKSELVLWVIDDVLDLQPLPETVALEQADAVLLPPWMLGLGEALGELECEGDAAEQADGLGEVVPLPLRLGVGEEEEQAVLLGVSVGDTETLELMEAVRLTDVVGHLVGELLAVVDPHWEGVRVRVVVMVTVEEMLGEAVVEGHCEAEPEAHIESVADGLVLGQVVAVAPPPPPNEADGLMVTDSDDDVVPLPLALLQADRDWVAVE